MNANNAPFKINETVIAVTAMKGSNIKNGLLYTVYSCEYAECKGQWFWYVGVICQVDGYTSPDRLRPSIFRSLEPLSINIGFEVMERVC